VNEHLALFGTNQVNVRPSFAGQQPLLLQTPPQDCASCFFCLAAASA